VFYNQNGAELGLALALMEVSNPFMHGIHLFREMKMADTSLATANQVRLCMCRRVFCIKLRAC
jgi:hypothetical protein